MAGTGKSTISRTLACAASAGGYLGGSFFLKQGEGDPGGVSKFFSTLASQLVSREPDIVPHIQNVIDTDPTIFGKAMREQLEKLILEPLTMIPGDAFKSRTLFIVVDALDECLNFVIRLGFSAIKGAYQDLILHEVNEPVIERDIHVLFDDQLTRIKNDYNTSVPKDRHLPIIWPSEADVRTLVDMTVPLFIFAATVCRFVADRKGGNPDKKVRKVLEHQTKSQESKLDATYMPVLEQLLVELSVRERENMLEHFRNTIGSIVVLASPLCESALARVLDKSLNDILGSLNLLYSVLSVPSSTEEPIRLLHLSFRDFLFDPEKQGMNPFWFQRGGGPSSTSYGMYTSDE